MPTAASPWLMVLLAGIFAITPFAVDTYLPAMPRIADDLHTHIGTVQQSLSIFLAAYGAGMLVFGPLADRFGRRPLALFGVAGFAIASAMLIWANNIEYFLMARALQAFCGAAATVVIPGVVRQLYQEHTAKGMSYLSLMMMLAPLIAPTIGSAILLISYWQTIFVLLFFYALIVFGLIWKFLPHNPLHSTIAMEKMAEGNSDNRHKQHVQHAPVETLHIDFFSSYQTVFSRRDAHPLIVTVMCSAFSFFCYLTAAPFVFIKYFSVSEQMFSLLFAIIVGTLMLSNFINTRFVTRYGSPFMVRTALLIAVLLASLLCAANLLHMPIVFTVIALAPLMGCLSMISTNTDAMLILKFPHHAGTATAVTGTLRYGCGALAGPVLALTFTGTAVPFSALMLAGVIGIAACQVWILSRNMH